ncbi:MAG: AMP-binding protein, partial [Pseudomonadales bacterium]|nr:AMP-binding protein [Pseudomonadales bacterium]
SVIMTKFNPREFLQMASDRGADYTFLVPTMIAMLLEVEPDSNQTLCLRRIAYGAASIAPSLMARAEERFGRIFAQCYGQAESPMVITCLQPEDHDRIGSCGRPFSVAEVAILNGDDQEVAPGERGEICVRGPQLMARYWNRPEATAEAFRNGWLHTGDVGTMDEDGFFYLVDRKNDLLVSGGYNVYPREVEDVLLAFPGVVEAAVVGIPDDYWGDRVIAAVAGSAELNIDTLMIYARGHLASYKCPKAIEHWPELPKSGANKILRRAVRDEILKNSSE